MIVVQDVNSKALSSKFSVVAIVVDRQDVQPSEQALARVALQSRYK